MDKSLNYIAPMDKVPIADDEDVQLSQNLRTRWEFTHENDTDDIPNDPFIDKTLNYVEPPTEVNLQFNHENDT
jgi:hypothetical protein